MYNFMQMAHLNSGSKDTRFLREEIKSLEEQLRRSDRSLKDMANELEKEKQVNEQLALRNEETDNQNSKLRRENEQLRQDAIDFQRQIDSQRETLMSHSQGQDYKSMLSKKNMELVKYLDEIQILTEANEKLELQNKEFTTNIEESVREMEKMTDEYNRMKVIVQHSDSAMDCLRKEKEQYRLQVLELTEQLKAKNEEDDPVMRAVNAKVEEWKLILASKEDEISEYQQSIINLREKLKIAQLDADKSNVLALQQGLQEKDNRIKMLTELLEQHTKEMDLHSFQFEQLQQQLKNETGTSGNLKPERIQEIQANIKLLEQKLKESERIAELAENDAREKDKDLVETLKRMREYEAGLYGLEEAVAEIKELKSYIKVKDQEIESLIKDINKLGIKTNDILDENEELKERLGLDPKTMIDLTEFKNIKALKHQQYRAENQILLKEIERLEEERIQLKQQIRKLAQEKGKRAAALGLTVDDLSLSVNSSVDLKSDKRNSGFLVLDYTESKNEHLSKQLNEREQELERCKTIIVELKYKLKEISEKNLQLEQIPKEILQAIKDVQKDSEGNEGESTISVPSLERLVHAIETKSTGGTLDVTLHLKAQVNQLIGRNEELRHELKISRRETINISNALDKAKEKISHLENELLILRQSEGTSIVFKAVNLPQGMPLSSTNLVNSLNEYVLNLLQEIESKEKSVLKLEEALEEYKRKCAVIRHQQGLFYKEYISEQESWKMEFEKVKEDNTRLNSEKELDMLQIKEYTSLIDALQMDPDELKKRISEASRKIIVLRVNEKSITRRYTTLQEMEQHLRKENGKMKNEISEMEAAVAERIEYLQRYKEIAAFKIAALQKALDDSAQLSELETANKQYNELTTKYRDLLQKDNVLVQRTANMEHLEHENSSLKSQIEFYNKELEITKEKLYTLEQAWEQVNTQGDNTEMIKATKTISNNEIISISKKITMLEMKEINERQRAEHSQKMYEHLRSTLEQVEQRNFELEAKFAELTKINLEAQKVEQALRDDLANSISKEVSDADKRRIMELEKTEAELKAEVSKLRNISDIAKMQVSALASRQISREKEVESLRKQVLDFQDQSDERALIAKLHQQIVALQISESTAVGKLEATTAKLHKMEAYNLRLQQKIDDKEQALYYSRLEGRNRAKHLRQTIQSLRRQFSGALPLAQQEKFSKTMMQLQNDKIKIIQEMEHAQQERRDMETRSLELEQKLKGVEELIGTLKDVRGAQKVTEWHKKMERLHLQDLRLSRELNQKKEEVKYLSNIISEQDCTIRSLEEELIQQRKFHEERQMSWDQREVELERQLDIYEHQQNEVLSAARKFEEATGRVPDSSLPLTEQLEIALRKIKEHVQTILKTKSLCMNLEEKLKVKDALLRTAEQNVLSRDKVINELRLQLPATALQEKLLSNLTKKDEDVEQQKALNVAHQTLANMQARLDHKEEVLKKYQHLIAKAREDQEEFAKRHAEDLKLLHQKLDMYSDSSLNKFKEAAKEFIKKPSLQIPSNENLLRLAEMEQTIAEQDNTLTVLSNQLRKATSELEIQKKITIEKVNEFDNSKARLEESYTLEIKKWKNEAEDLKNRLADSEKEVHYLNTELDAQKEANTRAPTTTLKNLVERLKNQVALKEKQQKALSKALLVLRAEMTTQAEQQIIAAATEKEENLNIQQIVDKQTKELKARIEELNEQQLKLKEALKNSKSRENTLTEDLESVNQDLRGKWKALNKLQKDKDALEQENEELKKKVKRLTNMQNKPDTDNKQNTTDELQRKIKKLEFDLAKKSEEIERKSARDDKTSKEEIIRWEEGKKWQSKTEMIRSKLKEKEKEVDSLTKQLSTVKELYSKIEQEKIILQKKLKSRGVTVDQVVGVRTAESERDVEELRKRNQELENDIAYMKTKQAMPRDSVIDDLHLKNRFLQEKLQALERQISRENLSRPSTSGVGSEDQTTRDMELQKENLRLTSENLELQFHLEQANKDLPRLKDQVTDLKEMCDLLKKEKAEAERKLGNVRGSGRSGKTVPELEKTIALMKRVVEKVQRENDELKRTPGVVSSEKLLSLEQENEKLKLEIEKLHLHMDGQLSMRCEAKTKGIEKVIAENERLRKELKMETETSEKLRIVKRNVEVINEKLTNDLEETRNSLSIAERRGAQLEGADGKSWKPAMNKLHESKVKEIESELRKKNDSIVDLKTQLKQATDREKKAEKVIQQLKDENELLKNFPEDAKKEEGLVRDYQALRLNNSHLEKEKAELEHQLKMYKEKTRTSTEECTSESNTKINKIGTYDKHIEEIVNLQTYIKTSDIEKQQLKEEIKNLKKELQNFDPTFFEEIEDLKYNYNEEVKKNILLEEKLNSLSEQFGIHVDLPVTRE
ncbi:hypothetical protein GDO86_005659 [Hymenochirus boettgeri]|uniref:Centrosomal protein of 290kDa coiled-coil region domain-containing protein n=1 Tax=Hymenochirus boettgeri TaxID=247094 RepID=A0A8T2J7F6_9PIPI|nr:hypothetical protein GDO86_005659 [Hymenochirus boettgeri]